MVNNFEFFYSSYHTPNFIILININIATYEQHSLVSVNIIILYVIHINDNSIVILDLVLYGFDIFPYYLGKSGINR